MDKTPSLFIKSSVVDRNIAGLKAILHLVRIHEKAEQFARIDAFAIDPDLRDMLYESDSSMRYRSRQDFSPIYDNNIATLLAVAGIEVISRKRLKLETKDAILKLRNSNDHYC